MTNNISYHQQNQKLTQLSNSQTPKPQSIKEVWLFSFQPEDDWFNQMWQQHQLYDDYFHCCGKF